MIDLAVEEGATYLGLSYVHAVEDIRAVEERMNGAERPPGCIAKIKTRAALANLSSILANCPCVLIDRADLAGEVGLLDVPLIQRGRSPAKHWPGVVAYFAPPSTCKHGQKPPALDRRGGEHFPHLGDWRPRDPVVRGNGYRRSWLGLHRIDSRYRCFLSEPPGGSGRIPGTDECPARRGSSGWVDIPCVNPA